MDYWVWMDGKGRRSGWDEGWMQEGEGSAREGGQPEARPRRRDAVAGLLPHMTTGAVQRLAVPLYICYRRRNYSLETGKLPGLSHFEVSI